MVEKILEKFAATEIRKPKTILGVFVLFTFLMAFGFGLIQTETSEESQLPEDIEAIVALNRIRNELGGGGQSAVLIFRLDPEDPQGIKDIRDKKLLESMVLIQKQLEDEEFLRGGRSPAGLVDLEQTQKEINQDLEDNPESSNFVTRDRTVAIMTFSIISDISDDDRDRLNKEIREVVFYTPKPPGVRVDFAGSTFLGEEIGRSIGGRTGYVTAIGFVAVFIILYAFFRRPAFVGIAILPIILSTLWTFGTLGFLGIPLSPPLTGTFSIIIGLGIDFAIHIMHRFKEDRKKYSIEKAIRNSVRQVGKGLTLTSVTTITGFLALLSATLTFLQDFAIALTFGVFYSLVAAIGVIPCVLILVERRRTRTAKR
ncbi:MAG: MMPL family transporter [archaeon]|nr:MAG: MMPL family transporter [archaeon]